MDGQEKIGMKLEFKKWLEMVGTGAIYDPKVKPTTFNWWGAVGKLGGVVIQGEPIKHWVKKKRKK
jgi:hypothetical protein